MFLQTAPQRGTVFNGVGGMTSKYPCGWNPPLKKNKPPLFQDFLDNSGESHSGWDPFSRFHPWTGHCCLLQTLFSGAALSELGLPRTHPQGVWVLEGVLRVLRRGLRLRRRRQLAGLDQGLRLRPDKVVLCLHIWSLPPLDDLRRRRGRREIKVCLNNIF